MGRTSQQFEQLRLRSLVTPQGHSTNRKPSFESGLIDDHSDLQRGLVCRIENKGQAGVNSALIDDVDRNFVKSNRGCDVDDKVLAAAQVAEGQGNIGGPPSRRKANIGAEDQTAATPG